MSRGIQTDGPSDISWRAWTGRRMRWTNSRRRSEERNTNDVSESEFHHHHHGHHGHHKFHKKNWRRHHQERDLGRGEGRARLGFGRKRLLCLLQYLLRAEDEEQGENPGAEEVVEASSDWKKGKREKRIIRRRRWLQGILEHLGPDDDGLKEAHTGGEEEEAGVSGVAGTSEEEGQGAVAVGEGAGEMELETPEPSAGATETLGEDAEDASGKWRQRLIAELCEKLFGNDGTGEGEVGGSSAEEKVEQFSCRRGRKLTMKRFGWHRSRSEDGPRKSEGEKHKGCRRKGKWGESSSSSSSEDERPGKKEKKRGSKRSGMYKMKGPCGGRMYKMKGPCGGGMRRRMLMRDLLFPGGFPPEGGRRERMMGCRGMSGISDFRNRCMKKRMMKKAFKRFY